MPETEAKPPKRRRWWRLPLEVALVLAAFLAIRAYNTRNVASGPAPALAGADLNGVETSLQALRGRPVLVQFWATWCPVCVSELGTIDAIAKDHAVLSVATQSKDAATIKAWMEQKGVSYPTVPDPRGDVASAWGVNTFPTSVVVGPDGTIRFVEVGYTTSLGLRARLWLAGR